MRGAPRLLRGARAPLCPRLLTPLSQWRSKMNQESSYIFISHSTISITNYIYFLVEKNQKDNWEYIYQVLC